MVECKIPKGRHISHGDGCLMMQFSPYIRVGLFEQALSFFDLVLEYFG